MSLYICTSCASDIEDCDCDNCMCPGCLTALCGCLRRRPATQADPLDTLIEKASALDLGALYRAAQKTGLIKPVPGYPRTT